MNYYERQATYCLVGIAICLGLLAGLWFFAIAPDLVPVWTDQGKITNISGPSQGFLQYPSWNFIVKTDNHGTVSPVISDCGWEVVGNTVYVTLLKDGKFAQTDSGGNVICTR